MFPAPTKEDLLTFELSQREGEIAILRQRLATVEAERDLAAKTCAALRSTLSRIHVSIHDHLYDHRTFYETHFNS